MKAAIDNDVLFKGACYGLLAELTSTSCSKTEVAGVLGSARFLVSKKIEKGMLRGNRAAALATFLQFLSQTVALEPTNSEQGMAADLELTAQKLGINLDGGESQLCAILVHRALQMLLTGDKRAIAAMEKLIDAETRLMPICGKVKCLEQLVHDALDNADHGIFRRAVCAEPDIDKALAICFSCTNQSPTAPSVIEGLQSYIRSIRREASRVLSP